MSRRPRVAVFIDVANVEAMDLRCLMARAEQLGYVDEVRAYGDFRQRHLDPIAIELYALGVHMVHCPSWRNSGWNEDSTARRKRTDDRLLEAEVRALATRRSSVSTYVLATGDADILPTYHSLKRRGKRVILVYPSGQSGLSHVLLQCGAEIEEAPVRPDYREALLPSLATASESCSALRLIQELDQLEEASKYVAFTYAMANLWDGGEGDLREELDSLLSQGAVERYAYAHPQTRQTLPAIRLNRSHPLVIFALNKHPGGQPPTVGRSGDPGQVVLHGGPADA